MSGKRQLSNRRPKKGKSDKVQGINDSSGIVMLEMPYMTKSHTIFAFQSPTKIPSSFFSRIFYSAGICRVILAYVGQRQWKLGFEDMPSRGNFISVSIRTIELLVVCGLTIVVASIT